MSLLNFQCRWWQWAGRCWYQKLRYVLNNVLVFLIYKFNEFVLLYKWTEVLNIWNGLWIREYKASECWFWFPSMFRAVGKGFFCPSPFILLLAPLLQKQKLLSAIHVSGSCVCHESALFLMIILVGKTFAFLVERF